MVFSYLQIADRQYDLGKKSARQISLMPQSRRAPQPFGQGQLRKDKVNMKEKRNLLTGMVLSVACAAVFILTRQPYAGIIYLAILVMKGLLIGKGRNLP